jgi:hypothetical protein
MLIGINVTFWITQDYSNHEEVSSPHHSRCSYEFCSDKVKDIFTILHGDIKGQSFLKLIWGIQQYRLCIGSFGQIEAFKFSELVKIHIYTPLPILETTDRNHYHLQLFDCLKGNKWGINAFPFVYFSSITYFHIKRQNKLIIGLNTVFKEIIYV